MNLKKIKCVILDFDGTLYSNGDWSGEVKFFGQYLMDNNILPEYKTLDEKVAYLKGQYPNYHIIQYIFAYLHDNKIDDSDFRKFNDENVCEIRGNDIKFIDPKVISELAKYYEVYMISDSSRVYLDFYLDYAKIKESNFVEILSNEYNDDHYTKIPMMKKVLEKTGLKPSEIIMIGDSERSDIIPAKLVGLQTFKVDGEEDTTKILSELIGLKCKV